MQWQDVRKHREEPGNGEQVGHELQAIQVVREHRVVEFD
jgi:hypothetical protein